MTLDLEQILKTKLAATHVHVEDESADHAGHREAKLSGGGHYRVTVVSPLFRGKSLIERHRMIYEAVLSEAVHALAIRAHTPEEWASKKTS